jgi:hypothetical protein
MERPSDWLEPILIEAHNIKRGRVEDVEPASPIHQHLRQSHRSDDEIHNEWVLPGVGGHAWDDRRGQTS